MDPSSGYEAVSEEFAARREVASIGAETVRTWAHGLGPGSTVLDLGCGAGIPVTRILIEAGCLAYGIDASPSLSAIFGERFPQTPIACEAVEDSDFFGRTFDAAIAWGLIFLLSPRGQPAFIHRVQTALDPGGRFLFTAPGRRCSWEDALTGLRSVSLGRAVYRGILSEAGFMLVAEFDDEGGNHYYHARKL